MGPAIQENVIDYIWNGLQVQRGRFDIRVRNGFRLCTCGTSLRGKQGLREHMGMFGGLDGFQSHLLGFPVMQQTRIVLNEVDFEHLIRGAELEFLSPEGHQVKMILQDIGYARQAELVFRATTDQKTEVGKVITR